MLKKTIKYTDFNDVERKEDFYFNLTKSELLEMEVSEVGGLKETIKKIVATEDNKKIVEIFKDLILKSYGEKSVDGKRFVKSEELSTAFSQTLAYDTLFTELTTNDNAAAEFINGLMPKDMVNALNK